MPYFKGVYFEQAFNTEKDVEKHNAENPPAAEEPVLVQAVQAPVEAAPAPTPEVALEALEIQEPPQSDPGFAVPVDRETPIVEMTPVIDAESDPFPSFEPEKEPETQPEEADEEPAKEEAHDVKKTSTTKKKSGGRTSGR